MSAPSPFDPKGPPLVTLEMLDQDFPVSEVFPFQIGREMKPLRFRVLSSSDKKELKRDAEIYISQDYADRDGYQLAPGEVSNWIGTGGGIEAVIDEGWLRCVVAATVHEYEPGKYAPVFENRDAARALLTDEQIEALNQEAVAHSMSFDPDEWSVEMFADMLHDAKKKGSASLIPYGTVNLAISTAFMVSQLSESQIEKLLLPESESPWPSQETGEISSEPPTD